MLHCDFRVDDSYVVIDQKRWNADRPGQSVLFLFSDVNRGETFRMYVNQADHRSWDLSNTFLTYLTGLLNLRINPVRLANARGGLDPVWLVLRAPVWREQAGKLRNFRWFQ